MGDFPRSLRDFEALFPDDEACARWLLAKRWPDGFRCPACGHDHGWELGRGVVLIECTRCHRQTSVTAGTVMHSSHLPLKVWFMAAWLVATHRNGISARQLWLQLGLGSYKTAWLLLAKLRRAMVDPEWAPLRGLVEVDETSIPLRTKDDPITPKPGRSNEGKRVLAQRRRRLYEKRQADIAACPDCNEKGMVIMRNHSGATTAVPCPHDGELLMAYEERENLRRMPS